MRRMRRSSGSSAQARASSLRSIADGSHCSRATTFEKNLGQKVRGGRTKCPPTVRSQNCSPAIATKRVSIRRLGKPRERSSANLTGYARSAAAYERGRPGYPPAAVDYLRGRLRLGPGRTVIDLAAGTGKLTRPLIESGAEVIAVEPVAEMRAELPPAARALDGTAEQIPLGSGSADAVTVAQAFHWFDGEAALAEIHRVLRPSGALALVWNRRRMDDPVNRAIEDLLEPYRGHISALHTGAWDAGFEGTKLFGPLEERVFRNDQELDADGLADRVASVNYIAALAEEERAKVVLAARALAGDGRVTIRQDTEVQVTERKEHDGVHQGSDPRSGGAGG